MRLPIIHLPDENVISHLTRPAVIVGVITVSAMFGLGRLPLSPKWLLLAIGGLGFALIVLKDLSIGLSILVFSSAIVGFSIGTGTQSAINLAMLLVSILAALWLVRMLVSRQVKLIPTELNFPLIAFLITALLSWIASYAILDPYVILPTNIAVVQAGQFVIFGLTIAAFLLTANHKISERTLKAWTVFIIVVGIAIVFARPLTGRYTIFQDWRGGLFMWPFVFLLAQMLFNPQMKLWMKFVGLGALALWVYWILTFSMAYKSSWVPAALAFLILFLFKSRKLFLVVLLILVISVFLLGTDRVTNSLLAGEIYSAPLLRGSLWLDVFRLGARSFLLGLGPVNYEYYWNVPGFQSLSYQYIDPRAFSLPNYNPPAHNLFADIFAQTGIVGLIFFTWALVGSVRLGLRVLKRQLSDFSRAYAYAVLAGFTSLIVASFLFAEWLLPFVYNLGLKSYTQSVYAWLLLGTLVWLGVSDTQEGAASQ